MTPSSRPMARRCTCSSRAASRIVTVENRNTRRLNVTAEMDVDFAAEKMEVFQQAWSYLRDNFFDARMNGVDWQATRALYGPLVAGAATRDEMRRLLNLMVGELNASHMGVNAPAGGSPVVGKLGLRFDRKEYEKGRPLQGDRCDPADTGGHRRDSCRRVPPVGERRGAWRARQSRSGAEPHDQPPGRSRGRDRCNRHREAHRGRAADEPGDREEPRLPAVGGEEPGLRC